MARAGLAWLLGAAFLAAGNTVVATSASAFAFLSPVTTPCATCPGGVALDIAASYAATPRWDATPGLGWLDDGIQVSILPGIPAAIGVSDPALAAQIESTIAA